MSSARQSGNARGQSAKADNQSSSTSTRSTAKTSPAAQGTAARRRLGRGLSSLLNEAIAVAPPVPAPPPPSQIPDPSPAPAPAAPPAIRSQSLRVLAAEAEPETADTRDKVVTLNVDDIVPSPFQPRRVFNQEALERLAASIRSAGVMQPILVRRRTGAGVATGAVGGEGAYELVAGERRWRAAKLAGLEAVPAIIAELGDEQAAEWALIENVQREELSAMERAWALRSLIERFGLTHAAAAEKVGLDRSSVTNLVRLTELEEPIRALLDEGRLSVGHGKALLAAPAGPGRIALARRAAEGGWSVRKLELAAPALQHAADQNDAPSKPEDEERRLEAKARELGRIELERQLGEHLGTKVHVRTGRGGSRGKLVIEFYDLDHFDGLMARIGFQIK